jgi:class 3 adenylate cyclase
MQAAIFQMDIRHILSSISAPTLVVHNTGDKFVRVEHGRYLAEHIPAATWLELPGNDHWGVVGDSRDALLRAVEEFATGSTGAVDANRVLATVLFTDVVGSTAQLAELGDRRWRDLLEDLDALVARQLGRFGGRLVNSTGDGYLATFDGPGRAIQCGVALREGARGLGLELRTGLHCGEIEMRGADVAGIAVHIAARVMALAEPGELLLSSSVPPLVAGSGLTFDDRGEHDLRGVPGTWRVFALAG